MCNVKFSPILCQFTEFFAFILQTDAREVGFLYKLRNCKNTHYLICCIASEKAMNSS